MGIRRFVPWIVLLCLAGVFAAPPARAASVFREGGKAIIVDRRGERWDVTQAESLGFHPEGFQYGIGRDAFTPLDDSGVRKEGRDLPGNLRVIGVAEGTERRAYSVPRLSRHEVANSALGGMEIAVAY
jgi:hypothetical protein